jgi:hypothetical protein
MAIVAAMRHVRLTTVISDCTSAIAAIEDFEQKSRCKPLRSPARAELMTIVLFCIAGLQTTLQWVKTHTGATGKASQLNGLVDVVAKNAALRAKRNVSDQPISAAVNFRIPPVWGTPCCCFH